jgi:hypothetical protein
MSFKTANEKLKPNMIREKSTPQEGEHKEESELIILV